MKYFAPKPDNVNVEPFSSLENKKFCGRLYSLLKLVLIPFIFPDSVSCLLLQGQKFLVFANRLLIFSPQSLSRRPLAKVMTRQKKMWNLFKLIVPSSCVFVIRLFNFFLVRASLDVAAAVNRSIRLWRRKLWKRKKILPLIFPDTMYNVFKLV